MSDPLAHKYFSTACLHEFHDSCRGECKFCGAPCRCKHHKEELPPPELEPTEGEPEAFMPEPEETIVIDDPTDDVPEPR